MSPYNAVPVQAEISQQPLIAIYHTYTDESYIPTDGKPSATGNVTIMLVGDVFDQRLKELGF